MSTHHDCKHGKAYWQECEECKTASFSDSPEFTLLDGKPTEKQVRTACNTMYQGFSHAGPVTRAKGRAEAAKWLEIWQQVLTT